MNRLCLCIIVFVSLYGLTVGQATAGFGIQFNAASLLINIGIPLLFCYLGAKQEIDDCRDCAALAIANCAATDGCEAFSATICTCEEPF